MTNAQFLTLYHIRMAARNKNHLITEIFLYHANSLSYWNYCFFLYHGHDVYCAKLTTHVFTENCGRREMNFFVWKKSMMEWRLVRGHIKGENKAWSKQSESHYWCIVICDSIHHYNIRYDNSVLYDVALIIFWFVGQLVDRQ